MERIAGDPDRRNAIDRELRPFSLLTTTLVIREFLRTVIRDIDFIFQGVHEVGADTEGRFHFDRLHNWLGDPSIANFSTRSFQRINRITAEIQRKLPVNPAFDDVTFFLKDLALTWLEDLLRARRSKSLSVPLQVLSGLESHDGELSEWISLNLPFPSFPPFPSAAHVFLEQRTVQVKEVYDAVSIEAESRVDKHLKKSLERYWTEGEFSFKRLDQKQDWHLGDLLIALEAPSAAMIYTKDHHFDLLCRVLGLSRFAGTAAIQRKRGFQPGAANTPISNA